MPRVRVRGHQVDGLCQMHRLAVTRSRGLDLGMHLKLGAVCQMRIQHKVHPRSPCPPATAGWQGLPAAPALSVQSRKERRGAPAPGTRAWRGAGGRWRQRGPAAARRLPPAAPQWPPAAAPPGALRNPTPPPAPHTGPSQRWDQGGEPEAGKSVLLIVDAFDSGLTQCDKHTSPVTESIGALRLLVA